MMLTVQYARFVLGQLCVQWNVDNVIIYFAVNKSRNQVMCVLFANKNHQIKKFTKVIGTNYHQQNLYVQIKDVNKNSIQNMKLGQCEMIKKLRQLQIKQQKSTLKTQSKILTKSQNNVFYIFKYNDKHTYVQYPESSNVSMNLNLRNSNNQFYVGIYHINLKKNTQQNSITKYVRKFIKQICHNRKTKFYWVVHTDQNQFTVYQQSIQKKLETAYANYVNDSSLKQLKDQAEKNIYIFNFETMQQINHMTKKQRPIRRIEI